MPEPIIPDASRFKRPPHHSKPMGILAGFAILGAATGALVWAVTDGFAHILAIAVLAAAIWAGWRAADPHLDSSQWQACENARRASLPPIHPDQP